MKAVTRSSTKASLCGYDVLEEPRSGAVWDGVSSIAAEGSASGAAGHAASAAEVLYDAGDESLPTKSLSKMLSKTLGRKEARKIYRNRAEAVGG